MLYATRVALQRRACLWCMLRTHATAGRCF